MRIIYLFIFVQVGLHQFQYKIFSHLSIISKLLQSVCIVGGWTTSWHHDIMTAMKMANYEYNVLDH